MAAQSCVVDAALVRFRQRHRDARVIASLDLLAVEIAAVGDGIELLDVQRFLGGLGCIREL